jgi:hypothetical protein
VFTSSVANDRTCVHGSCRRHNHTSAPTASAASKTDRRDGQNHTGPHGTRSTGALAYDKTAGVESAMKHPYSTHPVAQYIADRAVTIIN